jgi:hypothetical protein
MSSQLFVVFRGLYPVAPPYVISVVRIHRIWRRAEPLAPIDGIVLLDLPAPRCEVACACGPSNIHWYWNICKAPKAWRASSAPIHRNAKHVRTPRLACSAQAYGPVSRHSNLKLRSPLNQNGRN